MKLDLLPRNHESGLKHANQLFKNKKYEESINQYKEIMKKIPSLRKTLEYNIQLSEKRIKKLKNLKSKKPHDLKILVLLHVFHEDVIDECFERIDNIPYSHDIIVTTPHPNNHPIIKKIKEKSPNIIIKNFENSGRDILPFIKTWNTIEKYDLCCKIHTKKGVSDHQVSWKELLFDGILGTQEEVGKIIDLFHKDDSIAIAGHEFLYASFQRLIGDNGKNIKKLEENFKLKTNTEDHNGFFMGTMFWFRPKHFEELKKLKDIEIEPEAGQNDGTMAHAIERILGSKLLSKKKIVLTRRNENLKFSRKIVESNYKSKIDNFKYYFENYLESKKSKGKIVGDINISKSANDPYIQGWLALLGNNSAREGILIIDDEYELDIECKDFRKDLSDAKINLGNHSFKIKIPPKFLDFKEHHYCLYDKVSGKLIKNIKANKLKSTNVQRQYFSWDSLAEKLFLKSMKNRSFFLNSRPLASIIMPTYNRGKTISNAIDSIINQTYKNFEIIIIDDGSTDNTEEIIKNYSDSRLIYLKTENGGVSKARNLGLLKKKGEYTFFLDSDNTWKKNYLEVMLCYFQSTNLDCAYSGLRAIDDDGNLKYYRGENFNWEECIKANYIDLNCFGFKSSSSNGLFFNEKLKRLVDWDYILNLSINNSISYAPFIGVDYYDGDKDERITKNIYQDQKTLINIISSIQTKYSALDRSIDSTLHYADYLLEKNKRSESVTTIILSFNHEKYIEKAIESVISQKTLIPHKIIISDDHSTDRTKEIIKLYENKYPNFITDISPDQNIGISKNFHRCISFSDSDYIAVCEGDDYWTNNQKLNKQVNFMRENQFCSMAFSQIKILNEKNNTFSFLERQQSINKKILSAQDFLDEPSMNLIANFSCCIFNGNILRSLPAYMYENRFNEIAIAFLFDNYGGIGFIKEPLSIYRQHDAGVWTGSDRISQLRSGLLVREMAKKAAADEYKQAIDMIITNKYIKEIEKLTESTNSRNYNSAIKS